jgi:hypothetical protein
VNESEDSGSQKDESLRDEVGELTQRAIKAESPGNDESFELDGFAFASFSDCSMMVVLEKPPSSGLFWDLFSALISMRPKGQTGKEQVDEQYSSERIQVTTTLENSLLVSMSHSRSPCLYAKGGVGALVELEEGFGACTSYAQWISGVESIKKVLGKQLKDFALGVLGNMVPNALAKPLLSEIKAQWYELVSRLDEFYKELTEEANFKAKPAWRLIGRWCVAAIFDAMAEARFKIALIEDPKPLDNKAKILWGVLRCHMIMQRFIVLRFQGHPIIVKEITMFMVTERVDPVELVHLQTCLTTAEAAHAKTNAEMKKVEDNYNSLKRNLDNLIAEFKPIKSRVVASKI